MISTKKGFTLLEMLLVIAIIAILAAIVIVAINPAKQLGDANNAQRQSDVLAILNAIQQYAIDNSGSYTALDLTDDTPDDCGDTTGSFICEDGQACVGGTDLHTILATTSPSYISEIPLDPQAIANGSTTAAQDGDDFSGYAVVLDSSTGRVTVCAPSAENDETISVTR